MGDTELTTAICTSDKESITVRGKDLNDLIGTLDFGEFFYFHLTGEIPSDSESRLFNAILVTVVEHGITPSVIAARLTHDSAPDAIQGAVSSGLLGAGGTFLGSMEDTAQMLEDGVDVATAEEAPIQDVAADIVAEYDRLPGFGHPLHDPVDPRTERLLTVVEEEDKATDYVELLRSIETEAQKVYDSNMMINATGAIGATVMELGLQPRIARGLALVSRSAGLVGHIDEEIRNPIARDFWTVIDDAVTYEEETDD
jgi:citrate synthase